MSGSSDDGMELCPGENRIRHRFSRSRSPERTLDTSKYPDIGTMFDVERFMLDEKWKLLPLLFWTPIGTVLAVVRVFMCFHVYLAANMLPQPSFIRRFVLRWMWTVMGMVVTVDDEEDKSRGLENEPKLLVSNSVSAFDTMAIHFVTDSVSPHLSKLPVWFRFAYGWQDFGWRESPETTTWSGPRRASLLCQKINRFIRGQPVSDRDPHSSSGRSSVPVHIMPEGSQTNGRIGLLKFQSWWVCALGGVTDTPRDGSPPAAAPASDMVGSGSRVSVHPVALSWWRPSYPCPIRISTFDSSPWADLFWIFFSPVTFVQIRFLPVVWKTAAQSDPEEFSAFVAQKIAAGLSGGVAGDSKSCNVVATPYTPRDREEYVKKLMFEAIAVTNNSERARPAAAAAVAAIRASYSPEIVHMAERLKEIVPTVPLAAIAADLNRTGDMDQTLTNFLEGHVAYTPEEFPAKESKSKAEPKEPPKADTAAKTFGRNSSDRMLSFQERKAALIQEARRKYLKKHGAVSDPVDS